MQDFYELYPEKFQNKTNGVTPRRWLAFCNPELSELITKSLGSEKWITHTDELQGLLKYIDDKDFQAKWHQIKQDNKQKLAAKIKVGDESSAAMFLQHYSILHCQCVGFRIILRTPKQDT